MSSAAPGPRRRGPNENTNGLLHQYFPKETVLSNCSQAPLDAVADQPNGRPRMIRVGAN